MHQRRAAAGRAASLPMLEAIICASLLMQYCVEGRVSSFGKHSIPGIDGIRREHGEGRPQSLAPSARLATAVFSPLSGHWSMQEGLSSESIMPGGATAAAHGSYDEGRLSSTGWAELDIAATDMQPSSEGALLLGMRGLGFLEGHFTCRRIEQFLGNFMPEMFKGGAPSAATVEWVEDQLEWVRGQAEASSPGDADHGYWVTVGGVLAQFDGIVMGYSEGCPDAKPLVPLDLLLLNLNGDLFDIIPALSAEAGSIGQGSINVRTGMPVESIDRPAHCSASVKLVSGEEPGSFADLLVGHATWDTFSNAYPRIYKHVTLPVWSEALGKWGHHTATFSSSPGFLSSIDDFYSISGSTSLFVQETSISVLDKELYKQLKPQTVPCFIRAVAANRIATGGESWAQVFSREHSGTYVDQWMVVDRSRFAPGMTADEAEPGLLWIVEEAPGAIVCKDMTKYLLSHRHWSSFNIAFFPEMRDYMGYTDAEANKGAEYSYTECARAKLFETLLPQVESVMDMQWVMRWNDYEEEPISNGNPVKAIAARGDLKAPAQPNGKRMAFGAIDSKVASWVSTESGAAEAYAIAGPTREQQAMFCWTDDFKESHKGHPGCFNMTQMTVPRSAWHIANSSVRDSAHEPEII